MIGRFGQIDVMMNNAAIVPHFAWNIPRWPLIADMPLEFWDRVVQDQSLRHVFRHQACDSAYGETKVRSHHQSVWRRWRQAGRRRNLHGDQGRHPHVSRYVAEEVRDSNICVVTFSPRVPIATETAPAEAIQRLPGPEVLGIGFVLCAQLPMEQSGKCFAHENGKLVDEAVREG